MAKLAPESDPVFEMRPGENFQQWDARTTKVLNDYQHVARKVQEGNPYVVLHAIIKFQVADGYALYRVIDSNPLTIQHLPYMDGYSIPAAHIRGLRKGDILDQIEWDQRMRAMSSGRS